ncbi:protein of unknown function (plasmid) [Streptantibioticus cattleyicolor NRRL 8057 = DSM 46488]|nr:protein of unknown function [Streptantibioticus cattleyicolor NRRL 8057 = DSM 46488]
MAAIPLTCRTRASVRPPSPAPMIVMSVVMGASHLIADRWADAPAGHFAVPVARRGRPPTRSTVPAATDRPPTDRRRRRQPADTGPSRRGQDTGAAR